MILSKDDYPIVEVLIVQMSSGIGCYRSIVRMDSGIGWNMTRRGSGTGEGEGQRRMRIASDLRLLSRTFVYLSAHSSNQAAKERGVSSSQEGIRALAGRLTKEASLSRLY